MLALILGFVPVHERAASRGRADLAGAVTVTGGLMAVVYAINRSVEHGWTSPATLGFLATGLAAALMFAAFFATIFQASLFMQQVLGYSALRTGIAYLAIAATAVVVTAGPAPRLLSRLGAGWALAAGQSASAVGLLLLARVPADADYWTDLFPGFVLVGAGIGLSLVAAQVAAFIGIPKPVSGLAAAWSRPPGRWAERSGRLSWRPWRSPAPASYWPPARPPRRR